MARETRIAREGMALVTSGRGTFKVKAMRDEGGPSEMARNVRSGLRSKPKDLSPWPKYFYDAKGSELFEEITELPEYYQTRTELSILREKSEEIVSRTGCRQLVELGSGSARKTRALLDAMLRSVPDGRAVRYMPLDVSESALRESGERLLEEYPGLEIRAYVGDFDHSLGSLLKGPDGEEYGCRLVIFLGGTIGNFTPRKRSELLGRLRDGLRPGDYLLVGTDLVKDRRTPRH
jgi:L-histidine N-alpha-methyltransferase